jgi:alcohol dehydrogenase
LCKIIKYKYKGEFFMIGSYDLFVPSLCGFGAVRSIGSKAKEHGMTKVLLVHDPFLKDGADLVIEALKEVGIETITFDGVVPDPTDTSVVECSKVMKAAGGIDGIIGLGGGSAMDTAKAVNVLVNNPLPLSDYSAIFGNKPTKEGLPLLLVPSTSGTGAECTQSALINFTEKGMKGSIRSANCNLAKCAIVDPEITMSMPPALTVSSGIDALAHACEAMTVKGNLNPVSDALAKETIRLVIKYLPIAAKEGTNIEAREQMGIAAMLAGMAFSNTLCHIGHAFGHSFGAKLHLPHGSMVGMALPYILEFGADVYPERTKMIGECMGLTFKDDAKPVEIGKAVKDRILEFYKEIDFPTFSDFGVTKEQAMTATSLVQKDSCYPFSPKPMNEEMIKEYIVKMYDRTN